MAGVSTTAGCPEFSYVPEKNAFVIDRLIAAGAIPIGKTNLDQFATGLNGTRSPYGIPACVFDERYISGGSSSGSAVAVARGLVAFSLGTDTAGSGRIPAALNNLVGVKPTRGLLSNNGLVPAARSLDCISVFARTIDDAMLVADIASSYDPDDPFSRTAPEKAKSAKQWSAPFTVGIPAKEHLEFFGDAQAESLFDDMVQRIERLGATWVTFDYTPFKLAAEMLYAGPWVAERLVAIDNFATENTEAIHPVVRGIILSGKSMSAVDAFKGQYRLAELTREAEATWQKIDVMLLPTTPTTYTIDAMLADPVRLNSNLGLYTNFVNLMDLSAIAFPAGMRTNGLPFGVSLIGRAFDDAAIAELGKLLMGELPVRSIVDTADTRQLSENAEADTDRGRWGTPFGTAAQSSIDGAWRQIAQSSPYRARLRLLCAWRYHAGKARTDPRSKCGRAHRTGNMGAACNHLWQLRQRYSSTIGGWNRRPRRRQSRQGFPVRTPRCGGRRRHYPLWRVAGIPVKSAINYLSLKFR